MTETFDIVLAKMPPSLNKRLHWAMRAKQAAIARRDTHVQARSALNGLHPWPAPGPRRLAIEVVRGVGGGRMQDVDNCVSSLKPVIDGLVDAGWLRDDKSEWLTDLRVRQRRDSKQRGLVLRVTVSDAAEDDNA